MLFTRTIFKSIWFYRKLNLTVILGVALSAAILLGALIVGDSVKYSLMQITQRRLGTASQVITAGERIFRSNLAEQISAKTGVKTAALLRSGGMCVIDGGRIQVNQLAVWGVGPELNNFVGRPGNFDLKGNEAAINENLAHITGLKIGDELMLRVNKLNTFPANTPFVSAEETTVSFRITISRILKPEELGNFSLQNIQSSPRNIFLNINWLNDQMKLGQKANVILVSEGIQESEIIKSLQQSWKLEDLNLLVRENPTLNYTELLSDRVFMEPEIERFCLEKVPGAYPVFSYFVNDFSFRGNHTPYSFVSTEEALSGQQILVSDWLSDDLKIKTKDTVRLSYFEVGPLRELVQKDTSFIVEGVFALKGKYADPNLMPVIPGLSDVGNCRDWKTGVPVDLKKIRPADEAYWKQFKGTPKAYISLATAKKLWGNRFGQSTAIRLEGLQSQQIEKSVLTGLSPAQAGFAVKNARQEGLTAAANGVDFGQLFIGLSFFVLASAFLLTWLLFNLFLGYRKNEIGTLSAIGFSNTRIKRLFFGEASLLIVAGIILGIPLGLVYNKLILKAINTIWIDIVRTNIAAVHVEYTSILAGIATILLLFLLSFFLVLRRFLNKELNASQKRNFRSHNSARPWSLIAGLLLLTISVALSLMSGVVGGDVNPELFYICGFCLLPGLILLLDSFLRKITRSETTRHFSFRSLIIKRLSENRKRNLMAVSFLAIGIFLVISTGLYRKESSLQSNNPSSGTGGYDYFIETSLPVLVDPASRQGREDLGLQDDDLIVSFQVQSGDDASCLNLNRITRPRIIACNPIQFNQRSAFSFVSRTSDLDPNHPWSSLEKKLPDEVLPAFADQTVIQWGLGKKMGDTLLYKDETGTLLKLKLIGGLENSVLQGNIVIAEKFFSKAYPSVSGANMFLVRQQAKPNDLKELQEGWRRYGAEITTTADRLRNFDLIENTYLNIFLMLGALGLLIGTIGLGIIIFRITFEQIPEYALLQAIGFQKSKIFRLIVAERLFLIVTAAIIGAFPAAVSALPLLLSAQHSGLWLWLPAIAILVIISGTGFSILAILRTMRTNLVSSLAGE